MTERRLNRRRTPTEDSESLEETPKAQPWMRRVESRGNEATTGPRLPRCQLAFWGSGVSPAQQRPSGPAVPRAAQAGMTPYSSVGLLIQFSRACGLTIQTKTRSPTDAKLAVGFVLQFSDDGRVGAGSMTESGSHANLAFGFALQIPTASGRVSRRIES